MSFAPLQLIQTATNKDVWGLCDDHHDKYLSVQVYFGPVSTKPMDAELFGISCLMVHRAEKNVYINIASDGAVPNWLLIGGTSVPIFPFLLAKGDLLTHNGATTVILPVGAPGTKLTASPSSPDGIAWLPDSATPPSITYISTGTTGVLQAPTLTWSHTALGTNRLLLVQISTEESKTITGITFNGVPLTQAVSVSDAVTNLREEQWYLIAPPIGTFNIVVTMSAAAFITGVAETITGVDQTGPIGAVNSAFSTAGSVTPSVTDTTISDFSLVIDGLATGPAPTFVVGPGQVANAIVDSGATRHGASSAQNGGTAPDAAVMSWTIAPSSPWTITAVEIRGISAATTGTSVSTSINQVAHGFSDGNIIRKASSGLYVKSQADTAGNAEVTGYVNQVIDADNFILVTEGFVNGGVPAGTPGDILFLSTATPGILQNTEPTANNTVSKPLIEILTSGASAYFHNYRGKINGGGGSSGGGSAPFTINQVAHGFAVGDIIRPTTSQWTKSVATSSGAGDLSSEAWAQVSEVVDADNFVGLPLDGGTRQQDANILALIAGYTGGDALFLDPTTPGAVTNVDPVAIGQVSKPIGYVEADSGGTPISFLTTNYRGYLNSAMSTGGGDLIAAQKNGANVPIPGGTLGSGNLIEFEFFMTKPGGGTNVQSSVEIKYGGQRIAIFPNIGNAAVFDGGVFVKGYFFADGSTGAQYGAAALLATFVSGGVQDITAPFTDQNALTIDSTIQQDFSIDVVDLNTPIVVDSLIVRKVKRLSGGVGTSAAPFKMGEQHNNSGGGIDVSTIVGSCYDSVNNSIYTVSQDLGNGPSYSLTVRRWLQDSTSGVWYVAANDSFGVANGTSGCIAVNGTTVYLIFNDSINNLRQYSLDLSSSSDSLLTFPGTPVYTAGLWTDGTDLWLFTSTTRLTQHNIAGNTNTNFTAVGFTTGSVQTLMPNAGGTALYTFTMKTSGVRVQTMTIGGGNVTQTGQTDLAWIPRSAGTLVVGEESPTIYSLGSGVINLLASYPIGYYDQGPSSLETYSNQMAEFLTFDQA